MYTRELIKFPKKSHRLWPTQINVHTDKVQQVKAMLYSITSRSRWEGYHGCWFCRGNVSDANQICCVVHGDGHLRVDRCQSQCNERTRAELCCRCFPCHAVGEQSIKRALYNLHSAAYHSYQLEKQLAEERIIPHVPVHNADDVVTVTTFKSGEEYVGKKLSNIQLGTKVLRRIDSSKQSLEANILVFRKQKWCKDQWR